MPPTRKAFELVPQQDTWLGWYLEMVDRVMRQNQQFMPIAAMRGVEVPGQQLQRVA